MAQVQVLDVMRDVSQLVRRAPNATLISAYVRAARKFCRESRWFRSTLVGETVADTRLYSLGSDTYMEVVGIRAVSAQQLNGSGQPWALAASDPAGWYPGFQPSQPQRYAYIPEGQIAVDPLPDKAYTLTMTLQLQPKAGVTSLPEELFVKWDQAMQDGALMYLLNIPGQAWTNPQQAELHRRAFQAAINNAKLDEQRGYNTGTVFIRKRPFIAGRV